MAKAIASPACFASNTSLNSPLLSLKVGFTQPAFTSTSERASKTVSRTLKECIRVCPLRMFSCWANNEAD